MNDYETTHPWITFDGGNAGELGTARWVLLGQARAMCEQLKGVALPPETLRQLLAVSLDRGVLATAAIEGNTLSAEQVAGIREGTYTAPPSKQYQQQEIDNLLSVLNGIDQRAAAGELMDITAETICEINEELLTGTDHEADAVPGRIRDHSVVVGDGIYRGAPARDCPYLLERLAAWLSSDAFRDECPALDFCKAVIGAIYAHLYLAWIHPFGDGNGRTARMLEYVMLTRNNEIPRVATHLLWNHYYGTLERYYGKLRQASESNSPSAFVGYAIEGFVDGLSEHVKSIEDKQFDIAWINHVHNTLSQFPSSPARDRRRALVLAMERGPIYRRNELQHLTGALAASYDSRTPRTLSRDLNWLEYVGLIQLTRAERGVGWKHGWCTNHTLLLDE